MIRVLNLGQFEQHSNTFYCNTVAAHIAANHSKISHPHRHDFYLTVLFTKGRGIHEIDFIKYTVQPGAIFFLNPGQMHYWDLCDDADGYILFHTREFYDIHYLNSPVSQFPFFTSHVNTPVLYTDTSTANKLTDWFSLILTNSQNNEPYNQQYIVSLLTIIYIECTRKYIYTNNITIDSSNDTYLKKFMLLQHYIERYFLTEKSPSAYAGMLAVSTKHLNRISQWAVSKSTSDIITDRVLLEAKRELIVHKKSFATISEDLGYDDYAYFSRLFKHKTGYSPSQFLDAYNKAGQTHSL